MSKDLSEYLGKPWSKRPKESDKAYGAFMAYIELGPERTYRELARTLGRPVSYEHQVRRWVARYSWDERLAAYDSEVLERAMSGTVASQQRARQILVGAAEKAARRLVAFVEGDVPETHAAVVHQACCNILEYSGIVKPKRLELIDDRSDKAKKAARAEARKLSGPMLDAVEKILATDSTGQAVH